MNRLLRWLFPAMPPEALLKPTFPRPLGPPPRELTYTEKVLLERLRARVSEHACPICGIRHGGPGA